MTTKGFHHDHRNQAKTRAPVAWSVAQKSASSRRLSEARARTVYAAIAGEFGLPRCGTGVRYGASVSARISSGGATTAASRSGSAFLNVTLPAKLIRYPASAHWDAMDASPEKQWKITLYAGHGA